jgi:hypothetical protein
VDRKTGESSAILSWIDLCEWTPEVWEVCYAIFRKQESPEHLIPTMLQAWHRMR